LRIVDNDRTALTARAQAVSDAAAALREELARRSASEAALATERDRLTGDLNRETDRAAQLERELAKRMADLSALSGRHESLGRTLAAVERTWMGRRAIAGLRRNGS
jgi:predicted  nucleic acid-binding Zn-ribbon protein